MKQKKTASRDSEHARPSASVALDPGPLANSFGFALRMASNAATQRFHQVMRPFHIRPAQFSTLILIHANPGVRQRDICEALRIEKANFVGLLDTLERRKLVDRRADPNDRRRYAIHLTKEGEALLRKAVRAHDRMEAGLEELLPARGRKEFLANLARIKLE